MEPFKNNMSLELAGLLADHLARHLPDFDRAAFMGPIEQKLPDLELKERSNLMANQMVAVLPEGIKERHAVLLNMLHPQDGDVSSPADETGIRGWGMMPMCRVVGGYGGADLPGSLDLLFEMTKRWSAEFDIRPFLIADQEAVLAHITPWVTDPSEHVRRLVSEGTRPRLPWGEQLPRLIADPTPMVPLLAALRDDPSEYVRRSVANHLNDIAKDHPDLIAKIAAEWIVDADKNREKLLRHACRSLIKQGHADTMAVFGLFAPKIELSSFELACDQVAMGGALDFTAQITSTGTKPQDLVVDFVVYFMKANGKLAPKVFKGGKMRLAPHETAQFARKHGIKPITTRKYYAGTQRISLRINGHDFGDLAFELMI